MKNQDIASKNIIKYIKAHNISTLDIEHTIGIKESRLVDENTVFLASEFLELCSYLNIEPKKMR